MLPSAESHSITLQGVVCYNALHLISKPNNALQILLYCSFPYIVARKVVWSIWWFPYHCQRRTADSFSAVCRWYSTLQQHKATASKGMSFLNKQTQKRTIASHLLRWCIVGNFFAIMMRAARPGNHVLYNQHARTLHVPRLSKCQNSPSAWLQGSLCKRRHKQFSDGSQAQSICCCRSFLTSGSGLQSLAKMHLLVWRPGVWWRSVWLWT